MKKALYILSAVLMVFVSSCSKDEQPVNNNEVKMVQATINAESSNTGDGTKTIATKEGEVYKITWEAGDELSVFSTINATTSMTKFVANSNGASTKFTGEIEKGSTIDYAILPYDAKASLSGTTVKTNIPAEQNGDFSNIVLAGWPKDQTRAEGTEYNFNYQFEAVCGILKFHFNPAAEYIKDGETIATISITADRPIAGDAQVSYGSGKPVMTPNPNATGSNVYNTITITKDGGFTKEGDYYFATFPVLASEVGTMNISLRFETTSGRIAYVNAALPGKNATQILTANIVKNIGTVKVKKYEEHPFTSGEFTVSNDGKKVTFSRGNLQYQASGNNGNGLWRFAPNQWDAQGEKGNTTRPTGMSDNGPRATQSEWIDLFPWGHTGRKNGDKTYYPYNACPASDTYYRLAAKSGLAGTDGDWGDFCDIVNGDETDLKGTWRLPTLDEFNFIVNSRTAANAQIKTVRYQGNEWNYQDALLLYMKCGIRTGVIGSDGKEIIRYGVMLFPDGFTWPEGFPIPGEGFNNNFVSNPNVNNNQAWTYSLTEFAVFESAGVVFLPSAGKWLPNKNTYEVSFIYLNDNKEYNTFNTEGYYWTSNKDQMMASYQSNVMRNHGISDGNQEGCSVRLVKDVTVK